MKAFTAVLFGVIASTCSAGEIPLVKRSSPNVASVPYLSHRVTKTIANKMVDGTVNAPLSRESLIYYVNITVGTPGQNALVQLDTGSSDLFITAPNSPVCSKGTSCKDFGTYNSNSSSTSKYVNSLLNITYGDHTTVFGDFVTDDVTIGDVTVKALQFGVGYNTTSQNSVMGVGYQRQEVQVDKNKQAPYPNAAFQMAAQGLIQSPSFSVCLDDYESDTGSVLFGGVDTSRYSGQLTTVPVVPTGAGYVYLWVTLDFVTSTQSGKVTNMTATKLPNSVVLDTGSSVIILPDNLTNDIYKAFSATYNSTAGVATCDCGLTTSTDTIDFTFSGRTISAPVHEIARKPTASDGLPTGTCWFDIISGQTGGYFILGDPFLRSAYVVYDLQRNQIGLAQAVFDAKDSNILEIPNVSNASATIPGAVNATNIRAGAPSPTGAASRLGMSIAAMAGAAAFAFLLL